MNALNFSLAGMDDFFGHDMWDDAGFPESFTETTVEKRGGGQPSHIFIHVFVVVGIEPGRKMYYVRRLLQYVLCLHKVNNGLLLCCCENSPFPEWCLALRHNFFFAFRIFCYWSIDISLGVLSMFLKVHYFTLIFLVSTVFYPPVSSLLLSAVSCLVLNVKIWLRGGGSGDFSKCKGDKGISLCSFHVWYINFPKV